MKLKTNTKNIEKIHENKSCFFEKISQVTKPLARLTKKKRNIQCFFYNIRDERGVVISDLTVGIKKIIRELYK